jgi:hypothetical protein
LSSIRGLEPKGDLYQMHPTISHELLHRIGNGTIKVKPNIKEIKGDKVLFDDNTEVHADAIIYCTGYYIKFHFLDEKIFPISPSNEVSVYK